MYIPLSTIDALVTAAICTILAALVLYFSGATKNCGAFGRVIFYLIDPLFHPVRYFRQEAPARDPFRG